MEIADKIYQHVKAMPTEMAHEVFKFIEFLEFKHGITENPSEHTEETTYILSNSSLMQQIAQSQQTFQQGTGYLVAGFIY